jgi:hypothetical protein
MESLHYLSPCNGLDEEKIMECIYQGFHKSLGSPETRNLALQALNAVYGLNEKAIPSSLPVFESLMEKMFGKAAADTILNAVAKECTNFRSGTFSHKRN